MFIHIQYNAKPMKLSRYIISAPLLFATYILLKCPCERIPSCHIHVFYSAILAAVLLTVFENDISGFLSSNSL